MSIQRSDRVDMNIINLFPILCILYALLPKKVKLIPIGKPLGDRQTPSLSRNWSAESNVEYSYHYGPTESLSMNDTEAAKIHRHISLDVSRDISLSERIENNRNIEEKSLAPEYMLALYNRFSRNKADLPTSNIVRSFKNVNIQGEIPHEKNAASANFLHGPKSHVRTLTFNISSISLRENINLAELRIFTLIKHRRNTYYSSGVERTLSLLERHLSEIPETSLSMGVKYELISTRHLYGYSSDWETFDITSTVEKWVESGKPIHCIEIRIESFLWMSSFGSMDIVTITNNSQEPLLLVYSNANSMHSEHIDERRELISHEFSSHSVSGGMKFSGRHNTPSDIYLDNSSSGKQLSRHKRSRVFHRSSICRRRPMFVNFEDINWHTWIIAPRGYQAYQCVGKCYFPVNEHLTPSKHAIIQSTLHSHYPKKAVRACCVPTKLEPISILYVDEKGVITYKYKYDGMVVAECGCR